MAALEGDFQMSRVDAHMQMVSGPRSDTSVELGDGPAMLVLARGDLTAANVTAVLNGSLNVDLTPAGGTINQVSVATERGVILTVPLVSEAILNDEAAAEYTERRIAVYNGPPLGRSLEMGRVRSYVFPKSIGWAWFLFNGGITMDADGSLQFYFRMTGRFLDD